jgi:hypothetical protein
MLLQSCILLVFQLSIYDARIHGYQTHCRYCKQYKNKELKFCIPLLEMITFKILSCFAYPSIPICPQSNFKYMKVQSNVLVRTSFTACSDVHLDTSTGQWMISGWRRWMMTKILVSHEICRHRPCSAAYLNYSGGLLWGPQPWKHFVNLLDSLFFSVR